MAAFEFFQRYARLIRGRMCLLWAPIPYLGVPAFHAAELACPEHNLARQKIPAKRPVGITRCLTSAFKLSPIWMYLS